MAHTYLVAEIVNTLRLLTPAVLNQVEAIAVQHSQNSGVYIRCVALANFVRIELLRIKLD